SQSFGKPGIERDRRMQKEIAVCESYDCHTRRERERKPHFRRREILQWPVDDADIRPERLVLVELVVDRGSCGRHIAIALHAKSKRWHCNTGTAASTQALQNDALDNFISSGTRRKRTIGSQRFCRAGWTAVAGQSGVLAFRSSAPGCRCCRR